MAARWIVALCLLLAAARGAAAEPAAAAPAPAPVEVGYRAPRATPADAHVDDYRLSGPLAERADSLASARHVDDIVDLLYTLLALALLVRFRVGARLQRRVERWSKRWLVQALVFAPLFFLTFAIVVVPTSILSHAIARAYGLSIQSWSSFAVDWAIGIVIGTLLATIVVVIAYALMRRSPRRWWLWTWLALVPLLVFVLFLVPLVVDPLFNKFEPLAGSHPALADKIHAIAEKAGEDIPLDRMFEMKASEKTVTLNAYVTGIGASKRVVVWDTTLAAMNDREVAYVVGHELGHYVLGHMWIFLALSAAMLFIALLACARILEWAIARRGERWQIARTADLASLPLLGLVFLLASNVGLPIANAVSRAIEHQADAFGLHAVEGVVDDPRQAAAHAFVRLGETSLADPDPGAFWVWWQYNHPPIRDRVRFVLGG